MKVYQLDADVRRYADFAFRHTHDDHWFEQFCGRPIGSEWKDVPITLADETVLHPKIGDYGLLGILPVFSQRGVDLLFDFLTPNGELLPVHFGRERFWIYNVTNVIDSLDEGASKVEYFSTGEIMTITRYVFRQSALFDQSIFKIPQLPKAYVFVTDPFVACARQHALSGFSFVQVWSNSE